jgi:hypothetical protein
VNIGFTFLIAANCMAQTLEGCEEYLSEKEDIKMVEFPVPVG